MEALSHKRKGICIAVLTDVLLIFCNHFSVFVLQRIYTVLCPLNDSHNKPSKIYMHFILFIFGNCYSLVATHQE
jgi:hypothetical protein